MFVIPPPAGSLSFPPHPPFFWDLNTRTQNVLPPSSAPPLGLAAILYPDSWICARLQPRHHVFLPALGLSPWPLHRLLSTGYLPEPHAATALPGHASVSTQNEGCCQMCT